MNGAKGSSPWRRVACTIACLFAVFVVVDSIRASGPQPTAPRAPSAQVPSSIDRALQVAHPQQQPATAAAASVSPHRGVVNRYCVTCHNEKLKTGGLVLGTVDVDNISATNFEVLEKVVRKLQARAMPPKGMPRPDEAVYQSFVSHLETSLDRFAAANPNPGRPDTLRRLNRTEYQNAVRDLLDLEADVAAILPSDDSSYGFDNISVGGLSPTLLERYLGASQKISRLAVGTPVRAPGEETIVLPADLTQEDYFDGQIFGTRAGASVRYVFPVDGEYGFRLHLTRDRNERIEGLTEPHQLEVSIDGERLQLFTVNPMQYVRAQDGVPDDSPTQEQADAGLIVRAPVKAGPHQIQVAFLKKSSALIETARQPYQARFNNDRHPRIQPALHSVSITGPYNATGISDTPSRKRIFACHPVRPAEEAACAKTIVAGLARRAYRRPATNDDVQTLLTFYQQGRADGGFDYGIEMALRALLVSPNFLFRVEEDPANIKPNTPYRLTDLELASRLSFFLWSSIPDDELLDLAARGKLSDQATLERQVRRMLADRRSEALVTNFGSQWLYLRNLATHIPDPRLLPDFDDNLRQAMRRETELFFQSIIDEDRSVLDLLRGNYTFVNERLAKHYGIPNVYGSRFRRVTFEEGSPRGGLLGQGSILTVTSYGNRTSPVRRGKWVLENIIGTPVPPPPPDVPPLKEDATAAGGKVLTMRERMVQHRSNPVCAGCHQVMDPVGLAVENFDAIGRWRDRGDGGTKMDVSGGLPDGSTFDGVAGLRDAVAKRPDLFVSTLTGKLMTYALGRGIEYYDGPAIRTITKQAAASDYRFSSIILGIVNSTPFRQRRSQS
jgi:cytochrome c5